VLLTALSLIGTAAMLWVGGGIFSHGLEELHLAAVVPHTIHYLAVTAGDAMPSAHAVVEWIVGAFGSAVVGIVVGGVIVAAFHLWPRKKPKAPPSA
jgi:predicted DNA repair protein MutK